jgi:hypothetical protein
MPGNELVYLTIWILFFIGLAVLLFKKVKFFKRMISVFTPLLIFLVSVILHNLVSGWIGKEETVFFIVALLSSGVGIFLFLIWLVNSIGQIFSK